MIAVLGDDGLFLMEGMVGTGAVETVAITRQS